MVSYLARLAGVVALALPLVFAVPTPAPFHLKVRNPTATDVVPDSYIVVYEKDIAASAIASHLESITALVESRKRGFHTGRISAKYSIGDFKGYAITADSETINTIANSPEVAYVELNGRVYASYLDEKTTKKALTTQTGATWGLGRISHRNPGTTSYIYDTTAGSGTTVYVIDTGIYTAHSQFGGRATWGTNTIDSSNTDGNGHGTHCAGTIAGSTYGVAKAARLVAVKVLDASGGGTTASVISGIQYVTNNAGAKSVASLSLGGGSSTTINSAVRAAVAKGITVVVAAGNDNKDASTTSPANEAQAITVGAITSTDARASFSNYGSFIDVFAPGVNVLSSWIGSTTATNTISGTSMATPHVAGLSAYLIALEGLSTPAAVVARIKALATSGKVTNALSANNLIAYNGNGA